jgi:hypothetical protein
MWPAIVLVTPAGNENCEFKSGKEVPEAGNR